MSDVNLTHLFEYNEKYLRRERKNIFGGRCIYCQEEFDNLTLDHFIPKVKGGRNCMQNLVPACLKCNADKGPKYPDDWFFSQSFFSSEQWRFILSYIGDTEIECLINKNSKILSKKL